MRHKGRAQGDARVSKSNQKNLKKECTSVGAQTGAEAHRGQSVNAAGRGQGCRHNVQRVGTQLRYYTETRVSEGKTTKKLTSQGADRGDARQKECKGGE